ncbi:PAS domain-containing hybrid sensor histidine kinase/response regulator [Flavihumibacter petaseus]|uniref:histidine kinase n=1 Tax=Flavihumibacter petaseus NBRC 106054 TaxID=1220578 RepID=A0A0E9N4L6_9BACT|nr:PAS domain-containing hybrid sensor histidine kinase/response regulator [Flavihumibacter petaseus]GAO44774.1 putative two-component hybrid sensor and regulator [Flavihumibacter petaseus NBRC 106054]
MKTKKGTNILSIIAGYWEKLAEDYYLKQVNAPHSPLKSLTEIGILVAGLNMILCTVMKEYGAAFACLMACFALLTAHFLRLYNREVIAKWLVIISFNAGVMMVSYFVGLRSGVYMYFFPVIFAMIFLIDTKITKNLIISEIATLICFGVTFIIAPYSTTNSFQGEIHYIYNFRINLAISLCITGLVAYSILKTLNKKELDLMGEKTLGDTIFNTSLDAIFIIDLESLMVANCNSRALELFRFPRKETVLQSRIESLLGEEAATRLSAFSPESYKTHSPWFGNMEFSTSEGAPIYAYANFVVFEHQRQRYAKISILDITEVRIAEVETLKAKERAERAAKVKSRFLSNMSHELRTPLNAIIGSTNILHQEQHLDSQNQMLDVLKHSSEHMLELVNDILDYSKLEADKMELNNAPFNLSDLLHKVTGLFKSPINTKKLSLQTNFDAVKGLIVMGDEMRLHQVMNNLLSNAIKFTSEGLILVEVKALMKRSTNITLRFSVKDSGIGIAPEKQHRIFDKFYQTDAETTRKYGGSGLGLAISQYIVQKMGGELKVESAPGQGSTFFFTLTLSIEATRYSYIEAPAEKFEDLSGIRILVAEDNPVNMMIVKRFLSKWNADITEAVNGLEAIQHYSSQRFDLLLVDLEMPELDGAGVVAQIRKRGSDIPIIAFTAAVYDHMQADLIDKGFNDFIPKPFRPDDLRQKIIQYVSISRRASA